ncbi:DNA replication complex GINS protein SLD5-like [Liolophura sinensis]|uniref:DNA replication complex GINS protein SLD5-like n=1 Tax=Liolophura sinensis TaxID=3198878 RepID=UPI0031585B68
MADLDSFQDESDEEMEAMTPAEVLEKMEEAWLNEKFAPELLDSKTELVECMLEQLKEMEENIKRAKKGDFKVSIHRLEIDRIRYILSSYLRRRLEKIEKFTVHTLEAEKDRSSDDNALMSPAEFKFASEYAQNMESHFKKIVLRHLPDNLQAMDPTETAPRPNLDSYVFLRVNEKTDGVLVEEETLEAGEEIIDLEVADQHLMRYKPVASLVTSGAVSLI